MVFKLVRTDAEDPTKILVPLGTCLIGRGKLLNCDDKRISRNHGEINVTSDNLVLKALHLNPCFYISKEKEGVQILNINSTVSLGNGDKFGLLPDSFWFKIMLVDGPDAPKAVDGCKDSVDTQLEETKNGSEGSREKLVQTESDNELFEFDMNDERSESPSIISTENQKPSTGTNKETSNKSAKDYEGSNNSATGKITSENKAGVVIDTDAPINETNSSENEASTSKNEVENDDPSPSTSSPQKQGSSSPESNQEGPRSPPKRPYDGDKDSEVDEKKVKLEPEDADPPGNPEEKPGTSNQNQGEDNNVVAVIPPQPVVVKPPLRPRERCIYGINCYRKNHQHRSDFSHPEDSDWGAGDRGRCPWGRTCRRRDLRHWQHHEHPPGVLPPPYARHGMQHVERQGNNIYIMNAHIVNIHDDHFRLVDSDGDSVDYDYEF